jgi:hypothetical protein
MANNSEPVVLELASLPREQMGPFLILGLEKNAARSDIDAHWADRLKWARKQRIKVPLEDINWARDLLKNGDRWVQADAESLNVEPIDGHLTNLSRRFGVADGQPGRLWQPLDSEKALADYMPPVEVPDLDALRAALVPPEVPEEVPAAAAMLELLAREPLDPWTIELPLSSEVTDQGSGVREDSGSLR